LDDKLLSLVSEVIQRSTRQRWADAVLRDLLKRHGGLSRNQSAAISRAVFSYYRWFGWLEPIENNASHCAVEAIYCNSVSCPVCRCESDTTRTISTRIIVTSNQSETANG